MLFLKSGFIIEENDSKEREKFMERKQLKFIAHRGLFDASGHIPENSMKAFRLAVQMGLAIELDVQLTSDGQVVVFHDRNLKRMAGVDKYVDECTLEFLKGLTLEGSTNEDPQRIPLLKEVLSLVAGKVPLLIEVKDEGFSGRLEQCLMDILNTYRGDYLIEAFNPYVVWWLREHAPQVIRGQLAARDYPGIRSTVKRFLLRNMVFHRFTKPDFVAYQIQGLNRKLSAKLKKQGVHIFTWTVRNEAELLKGMWLGDGVIFETFTGYEKFLKEAGGYGTHSCNPIRRNPDSRGFIRPC